MGKGPAGAVVAVVVAFAVGWASDREPATGTTAGAGEPPPRAAALPRGLVQLPAGVRVIPESRGFVAVDDVLAGRLEVPSGELAVDDYFAGEPRVAVDVPKGAHPLRLTLAKSVRGERGGGSVALATLITGPGRPVRWKRVGTVGTEGGMAGMASAEAAARVADDLSLMDREVDVLGAAGPDQVGPVPVGGGLRLFTFGTGLGDGGYPVYAGTDAGGTVSRIVLDGGLLHLDWPAATPRG